MRRRHLGLGALFVVSPLAVALVAEGCSATNATTGSFQNNGGGGSSGSSDGAAGSTSSNPTGGGHFVLPDGGGKDVTENPCGTGCGDEELCDDGHLGLDDNCDGQIDEGCSCSSGQVHFCFKGDPSFRGHEGCFDGTMKCDENGHWGPCIGGVHALPPDNCQDSDLQGCHSFQAPPFADVALGKGVGDFNSDADPGSETWTVECPLGVSPCPGVTAPDGFKPLQSGEYKITYTKEVGGEPETCNYSMFVGAPGLRVELDWEHLDANSVTAPGVDVDLHVKQPSDTGDWALGPTPSQNFAQYKGLANDCGWVNCKIDTLKSASAAQNPHWFADAPATPPAAVNWFLDPVFENNTCYFAPRGVGDTWQAVEKGCHNPRLDLDNVLCGNDITDVSHARFCAPENINIDYPPRDKWMRIAVFYWNSHDKAYDVHPNVRIFCDGSQVAELGHSGYYVPNSQVTFTPADGENGPKPNGNKLWYVADVKFENAECGGRSCVVKPIYTSDADKTPHFDVVSQGYAPFGPAYPP